MDETLNQTAYDYFAISFRVGGRDFYGKLSEAIEYGYSLELRGGFVVFLVLGNGTFRELRRFG